MGVKDDEIDSGFVHVVEVYSDCAVFFTDAA